MRFQYVDKSEIPKILAAYVTRESYEVDTSATNGLLAVIKSRVQDLGVQERDLYAKLEHVKEVQGHGASLDQVADVQGRLQDFATRRELRDVELRLNDYYSIKEAVGYKAQVSCELDKVWENFHTKANLDFTQSHIDRLVTKILDVSTASAKLVEWQKQNAIFQEQLKKVQGDAAHLEKMQEKLFNGLADHEARLKKKVERTELTATNEQVK